MKIAIVSQGKIQRLIQSQRVSLGLKDLRNRSEVLPAGTEPLRGVPGCFFLTFTNPESRFHRETLNSEYAKTCNNFTILVT